MFRRSVVVLQLLLLWVLWWVGPNMFELGQHPARLISPE